jgi:hypothetical protein
MYKERCEYFDERRIADTCIKVEERLKKARAAARIEMMI